MLSLIEGPDVDMNVGFEDGLNVAESALAGFVDNKVKFTKDGCTLQVGHGSDAHRNGGLLCKHHGVNRPLPGRKLAFYFCLRLLGGESIPQQKPFIPAYPFNQAALDMLDNEIDADVVFEVREAESDEAVMLCAH